MNSDVPSITIPWIQEVSLGTVRVSVEFTLSPFLLRCSERLKDMETSEAVGVAEMNITL